MIEPALVFVPPSVSVTATEHWNCPACQADVCKHTLAFEKQSPESSTKNATPVQFTQGERTLLLRLAQKLDLL